MPFSARLYIIAGNQAQALRYAGYKGMARGSWVYVDSYTRIMGSSNPRIALVGTWYERPDRVELGNHLLSRYDERGTLDGPYAGMARELAGK